MKTSDVARRVVLAAACIVLVPLGSAVAQPTMGSLYGSKNIQFVSLKGYPVYFPDTGAGGEVMFGFNTLSAKTEDRATWKYYYGVELGGGGVAWRDSEIGTLSARDAGAGYALLQIEGKLFHNDSEKVRPYFGWYGGIGTGSYTLEQIDRKPDVPAGSLGLYEAGVETGMHLSLGYKYWLVLGVGMDVRAFTFGSETELSYPAYATVGVCRWRGPMK